MGSNKSVDRSDIQKNDHKALVDAYEADKNIQDTYGDTVTFKRRRDDADDDQEPFAGSDRGSKRRRARKEPESSTKEPMHTSDDFEKPTHQEFETGVTDDQPKEETYPLSDWIQKPTRPPTPDPFVMNRLNVETLTPELLADLTFELMKGTCKSLVELEYFFKEVYKATIEQLDWHNPKGQQYPHDLFAINRESARDVYSRRRIIAITKLQIVEWHGYKHLDWITIRRDDDKLHTFKEGDFKRLRL
ncbi:hypothetical protein Tco_0692438 [Tanacetum coccineum]